MEIVLNNETRETVRVKYDDGTVWVRKGHCNQCGDCCKFHPTKPPGVPFPNMRTRRCAQVFEADDGTWRCSIYDDRPYWCAVFPLPEHMDGVGPRCTISWEKEDNTI
jgi:Fe-S-cluster containining protein